MAGAAEAGRPLRPLGSPSAAPWLLRLPPPLLAGGLALAGLLIDALTGVTLAVPLTAARWAGGLVAAAGLAWLAWARFEHARLGNPIRPVDAPRILADEGPYRFGRHPMYLGLGLMLCGLALAQAAPALGLAAAVYFGVVSRVHVAHEEAVLRRSFGGWYSDYAASVRRWI